MRRIELISATTNRIRDGNIAERVLVSGSGDEFDRLASGINSTLDAIQDLTEGIGRVSHDIAHDLRTPLTRLRHGLEAAQRKGQKPEEFKKAIDHALKQVDTLLSMFGALLRIGRGIPGELREKAFRRFYRLDASRRTPGSGLGLSIVAAIAKLHEIEVELTDNAPGLRASLRFPPWSRSGSPDPLRSRPQMKARID